MPSDGIGLLEPTLMTVSTEAAADNDTSPYHSSSNSHRHNHTVSSISHISRATIHEDDFTASVPFQGSGDVDHDEEGKNSNDRSASLGHLRSKSALIDQNRISIPTKFESFSSSIGLTTSAVRRPSVACLKVNVNAARAGKHRIEHIESPALVLETGFEEGQTDPDNHPSNRSCRSNSEPKHRRSHRLAVPEEESAQTDSWSAYLDTSCDSASNFIVSKSSRPKKSQKFLSQQKSKSLSPSKAASSPATSHRSTDKKNLLSFVVGEHSIALSQKEHQEVIVIEPKKETKPNHNASQSTFIISQGRSINEALRKLSIENRESPSRRPQTARSPHFARKDVTRLRKTLVQICTSIVDEAIRNVYIESVAYRRSQKRLAKTKKSMSEVLSAALSNALVNSHKIPISSRHKKIWSAADSCSDLSTDESSAEDEALEWSDDQFAFSEHLCSVSHK